MKIERPQFELTRVFADGTSEAPEIIRVGCMPWDARMERRGFLGVGVGVAAVLLLVDGKAEAGGDSRRQRADPSRSQSSDVPDATKSAPAFLFLLIATSKRPSRRRTRCWFCKSCQSFPSEVGIINGTTPRFATSAQWRKTLRRRLPSVKTTNTSIPWTRKA